MAQPRTRKAGRQTKLQYGRTSFPDKAMVTELVPLHEGLRASHGYPGVEASAIRVVTVADEHCADLRSSQVAKRLGPQALSHPHLKGLGNLGTIPRVEDVPPEAIRFFGRCLEGSKIVARQLPRLLLRSLQRDLETNTIPLGASGGSTCQMHPERFQVAATGLHAREQQGVDA